MALLTLRRRMSIWSIIFTIYICIQVSSEALNAKYEYWGGNSETSEDVHIHLLNKHRQRRDVTNVTNGTHVQSPPMILPNKTTPNVSATMNNITQATTQKPLMPQVTNSSHLLGQNGSGIRKDIGNEPKVSEPIQPDESGLNETNQQDKTLKVPKNLKNDTHTYYNSSFIDDPEYFQSFWKNITQSKGDANSVLSNSYRCATTLNLTFDFPFYGQKLKSITIATGGFIYTGEHVHNWLAATQYIAPLMANFDTNMTKDSSVIIYDDGTKFTVLWDKVTLQEEKSKKFTFAVTLMNSGDIVFSYKDLPMPISSINGTHHPFKIGISDAYLTDKVLYLVRRKTIYEYHHASFTHYNLTSGTIIKLTPLPTCPQYVTCESCANHKTKFNCSWCAQINKCSSGIDRNKQDWTTRKCDRFPITSEVDCPVTKSHSPNNQSNVYVTDTKINPYHSAVLKEFGTKEKTTNNDLPPIAAITSQSENKVRVADNSSMGGVVAGFVTVILISSLAVWMLYAYKNPHTRSGQILIKYRPTQWAWKRGEARYTAATIHM